MKNLLFFVLFLYSCQSTYSAQVGTDDAGPALAKWEAYVQSEQGKSCEPRLIPAHRETERMGLVMFFPRPGQCPEAFSALGEKLASEGFDVFLPLVPEHGRTEEISAFTRTMNEIARLAPRGDKVLAGLSGGGTVAREAALTGAGIWDRLLILAPRMADSWATVSTITIPIQMASVLQKDESEASALRELVKNQRKVRLCFYPDGLPHAMLSGEDYWRPALEEDAVGFLTRGRWFMTPRSGICRYVL